MKKTTSERQKPTEATVVTLETVRLLRKGQERVDAAQAARIANNRARSLKTGSGTQIALLVDTSGGEKRPPATQACVEGVIHDEGEDLSVEMEALEVGGESGSEEGGGVVGDMMRVEKRN